MITTFLVVDEPSVAARMRMQVAVGSNLLLLGEAESVIRALERVPTLAPTVIIVDLQRPGVDTIGAVRLLRSACPAGAIMLLSSYMDAHTRSLAQAAGATSVISRDRADNSLLAEIRRATFRAA